MEDELQILRNIRLKLNEVFGSRYIFYLDEEHAEIKVRIAQQYRNEYGDYIRTIENVGRIYITISAFVDCYILYFQDTTMCNIGTPFRFKVWDDNTYIFERYFV